MLESYHKYPIASVIAAMIVPSEEYQSLYVRRCCEKIAYNTSHSEVVDRNIAI